MARVAAADIRTTTGINNKLILDSTGLDAGTATPRQVRAELRRRELQMTEEESNTALLLSSALERRDQSHRGGVDTKQITETINRLCTF